MIWYGGVKEAGLETKEAGLETSGGQLCQELVEPQVSDFVLFRCSVDELLLRRVVKTVLEDAQHLFCRLSSCTHDVPDHTRAQQESQAGGMHERYRVNVRAGR